MPSHYEALGIAKRATEQEINKAYRKLMRQYHPDKLKEQVIDEQFYSIQNAYESLSDPNKRKNYDARYIPPMTPHPLQPEIRKQLKTLEAHIKALNTETLPWFCYSRADFTCALDDIHSKSEFFLYGFLTGEDVVLIQIFLNHTLTMLDALKTASSLTEKFNAILNYISSVQAHEYAEELKELYGIQMDTVVGAHLAITSEEASFYNNSGLQHLDEEINRIALLQLQGSKKLTQQRLLRTLHTFRERVKEQLTAPVNLITDLLNLTAFLSSLSYQDKDRDQDKERLLTYQISSPLQTRSRSIKERLLNVILNAVLWFFSFLPKIKQRLKHYFESIQEMPVTAMTAFLDAIQDDSENTPPEVLINWSFQHQTPELSIWSPRQWIRSNQTSDTLVVFDENNNAGLDHSQAFLSTITKDEEYLVPHYVPYYGNAGFLEGKLESAQEEIDAKILERKELIIKSQTWYEETKNQFVQFWKEFDSNCNILIQQMTNQQTKFKELKAQANFLPQQLESLRYEELYNELKQRIENLEAEWDGLKLLQEEELSVKLADRRIQLNETKVQLAFLSAQKPPQLEGLRDRFIREIIGQEKLLDEMLIQSAAYLLRLKERSLFYDATRHPHSDLNALSLQECLQLSNQAHNTFHNARIAFTESYHEGIDLAQATSTLMDKVFEIQIRQWDAIKLNEKQFCATKQAQGAEFEQDTNLLNEGLNVSRPWPQEIYNRHAQLNTIEVEMALFMPKMNHTQEEEPKLVSSINGNPAGFFTHTSPHEERNSAKSSKDEDSQRNDKEIKIEFRADK